MEQYYRHLLDDEGEVVFHTFLPRHLLLLFAALGVSAALIQVAVRREMLWLWLVAIIFALIGLVQAARFAGGAVVLRGFELAIRKGGLIIHEQSVPLWHVQIETVQGLPGRLFDYGDVVISTDDKRRIVVPSVSQIQALRRLVAHRRALLLIAIQHHRSSGDYDSAYALRRAS